MYASASPSAAQGGSSQQPAVEVVVLKELLNLDQNEFSDDEGHQYDRWDSNTHNQPTRVPSAGAGGGTLEAPGSSEGGRATAGQKTSYQSATVASSQRGTGVTGAGNSSGNERGRAWSAVPFRLGGGPPSAQDIAAFAAKHRAINEQYLNPNR
jgi:hypothetical protein